MENNKNRKEYLRRIYTVQDYIEAHISEPLNLDELAKVSGFSKFHFHRIFKALMNETLAHYVNRLKLEKATHLLIQRRDMTVTDITYHFGYTDSAVFSRVFRAHYGVSPSKFREEYSKKRKDPLKISQYNERKPSVTDKGGDKIVQGELELVDISEKALLYVRFIGTYAQLGIEFPQILEKLFVYATSHQLIQEEEIELLSIYHDHPDFTQEEQFRTSICLAISDLNHYVEESNDIGIMTLPAGKYVVGHFDILPEEYSGAWDYIYGEWLSNSGYQPRAELPFEMYMSNPANHPQGRHLVDIYLPIETLY